ncbi:MAG TPA: class III extradiol dioxygenase subunit B-like domain-containing protein [Patescibacteria group bacterium]|nr:class III extradiol dioxygenase subunit B-like domain-containing protein [Patescibacteria group bacterium]
MSLNFAAISPHPPIIIPEIGQSELAKVEQTVRAMKKLSQRFLEAEIETLLVISPHMLIYPDRFSIAGMKKLFGTFASFNAPDLIMEFENNLELAQKIGNSSRGEKIETLLYDNGGEFFELDHGVMVPLFYLAKDQEFGFKILPCAYSELSCAKHFAFGQILGNVVKSFPGRVGLVASGDLSHRLNLGRKSEINPGRDFDQKIVNDLKEGKVQDILYYDEDFVEAAGECGYRSILILLGALDSLGLKPEILSYEGPFGVGYLVANYHLSD